MRKTIACLLAFAAGWVLLALTGCSKPAVVAGPVPDRQVADELRDAGSRVARGGRRRSGRV